MFQNFLNMENLEIVNIRVNHPDWQKYNKNFRTIS